MKYTRTVYVYKGEQYNTITEIRRLPDLMNTSIPNNPTDEQLAALVSAYFAMGGVNLAPSVLTKETLLAAREHPEQYQNLAVRIVGYSELYLRLPERMQIEILNRTEYAL